jgi:flagellar P-ring protein precursor FlgI
MPTTTTVDELVKALNTLGAGPRDLVSIFQALHSAGALDADLEVL